ncbi:MAG: 23S rRNA (guanosine(2251)-2'-O)-methyltransferase RlmB [Muribaculaceae bacterium]|nr:23S rRNA (guanosine(2251)-2'-O)-methyltransferase RlmB [Muribaculaceae bacterium]
MERRERQERQEYIFGLRAVIEAIESGKSIDKVLIRKDLSGDLAKELIAVTREYDIPVQKVPQERLNRVTMKNHQGAIAMISPVEYGRLEHLVPLLYEEGKLPLLMVLDGVTDTRNFGAIARTSECAGADALVIPEKGSASVTPEAVKTSAGALFYIPVCREKSTLEAVKFLKENGYKIVGATEKGKGDYSTADYTVPVAIVMGSEDTGISNEVLRQCDELVAIPILGNIGSLNVSVAAGVMLYEAVRQRLGSGMNLE